MSKTFEYRGDLAVTPLAEILATIHRYRVPGIISVSRGNRVRRFFVDEGLVVYAASNEKELGLVPYLLRQGTLDEETGREAEARRARDGQRMGQILLQMGVVTPERLNEAIAGLIREMLLGALEWDGGEVLFEVGVHRAANFVPANLPIPVLVLQGIRRAADVKRLVRRLGSASTVLEKTSGPPLSVFESAERRFYDAVDGKTPLKDLCARGPGSEAENARLLYAFFCLGLLRRSRATSSGAKKIQYKTGGDLRD